MAFRRTRGHVNPIIAFETPTNLICAHAPRNPPPRRRRLAAVYALAPAQRSGPLAEEPQAARFAYYPNCDSPRAAGAAPIHRGEPGNCPPLDAEDDGIACEPYRGR
ncbi:MAG TPA: excalibur calcium-binding domain-containing protein [Allosphingosinicella sp.]